MPTEPPKAPSREALTVAQMSCPHSSVLAFSWLAVRQRWGWNLARVLRRTYAATRVQAMTEEKPESKEKNTCNRHLDCEAANEKARQAGRFAADHCHDDCCEDCFGS